MNEDYFPTVTSDALMAEKLAGLPLLSREKVKTVIYITSPVRTNHSCRTLRMQLNE
jgi:hypothetical protein